MSKEDMVEKIINAIWDDRYNYEDWIFDILREHVSKWNDGSLKNFLGLDQEGEIQTANREVEK